MIKTVFLDLCGTAVYENGPISCEVVKRVLQSGSAQSPEEVVSCWWKVFQRRVEQASGAAYRTQYEVALDSFQEVLDRFRCREDARALRDRMVEHWCHPPIYQDTKWFLEQAAVPVYFVTNSDDRFVEETIRSHGLKAAGCITSQQARYPKPREEIYRLALERAGAEPGEVLHVGDSLAGDVYGPRALGIRTIWMDREGSPVPDGVEAVRDFRELMERLPQLSGGKE